MKTAMGLDPGIGNTGFAFVQRTASGYQLLDSGYRTTSTTDPLCKRLYDLYTPIWLLMDEHKPDILAIEAAFFNKNISSHNSTVGVIAIAELAAFRNGVPTIQIKPQMVKSAVTGRGTASKEHVKRMVNRILSIDICNDHEADAAAVAIAGFLKAGASM